MVESDEIGGSETELSDEWLSGSPLDQSGVGHNGVVSTVVEAIAEVEGRPLDDLGYALYDHVETDALVTLAASEHTDWQLAFTIPDHTVEVRGGGRVLVDGTVVSESEWVSKRTR